MLKELKQKARNDATLKPPKALLSAVFGIIVLIGTILIIEMWGALTGILFLGAMLVLSMITGRRFNV
jgi:hypothetical protein